METMPGVAFTFSNAFEHGWQLFRSRYGLLLGAVGILIGASIFGSMVVNGLQLAAKGSTNRAMQVSLMVLSISFNLGFTFLVNMPLSVGAVWMAVRLARGEAATIADVGAPFRRLLHVIAISLLVSFVTLVVVGVPAAATIGAAVALGFGTNWSAASIVVGVLGILGCIVLALYISARVVPSYLMVIDPEAGPHGPLGAIDSLSASWRLTRGHAGRIIGLMFVLGMILGATFMMCLLPGIFFGYPLVLACYAVAYVLLLRGGAQ